MASSSGCVRAVVAPSLLGAAGKGASVSRSEHPAHDRGFPRACRLTARPQFLAIYAQGRRVSCRSFVLFAVRNRLGYSRLGVTATRKLGGAVVRNRAKRVLREIFRRNREALTPAVDLVVNAGTGLVTRDTKELEREFLDGFAKLVRGMR